MTAARKFLALASLVAAITLSPISEADAAYESYLEMKFDKQGKNKGTTPAKTVAKARSASPPRTEVLAFSHEVRSARGKAGKRQHSVIHVTVEFDPNTAATFSGLVQSGKAFDVDLTFATEKKGKGDKHEYLKYELKDVIVSSYQISSTTGGKDVIIIDLLPGSFEGKLADGSVFVASPPAASPPAASTAQ